MLASEVPLLEQIHSPPNWLMHIPKYPVLTCKVLSFVEAAMSANVDVMFGFACDESGWDGCELLFRYSRDKR
jgi:hypothetical protein